MRRTSRYSIGMIKLLIVGALVCLLVLLRFRLKLPQSLTSMLAGDAHLYKWTNGNVHYKVLGVVDAPPLVLLHEPVLGGSAYEMRHMLQGLAQHYRVYVLDLPGFGLSDRPRIPYTAELYVRLCQDFLREVVVTPATLLAAGLSCNYAVAVAEREPQRCQRLILLSPNALYESRPSPYWLPFLLAIPGCGLFLYALLTRRPLLQHILARRYGIAYQQVSPAELEYISVSAHQRGAHYAVLARLAGALQLDVSQQWTSIQQPTLVIWGVQALSDHRLSGIPQTVSERTQLAFIGDGGMSIQQENPAQVLTTVFAWKTAQDAALPSLHPVPSISPVPVSPAEEPETIVLEKSEKSVPQPTAEVPTEAYCVRCRQKRELQNARRVVTKNGRHALEGTCLVCGTKLFRFVAATKRKKE